MHDMPLADHFYTLFLEQRLLMGQLLQMARLQLDAIREERMEELLALLGQKQPLLNQLTSIRVELKQLGEQLNDEPSWIADDRREACQQMKDEAGSQFEVLVRVEAECEQMLEKSKEEIRQRLETFDSGQSAAMAYQRSTEPRSSGWTFRLERKVATHTRPI